MIFCLLLQNLALNEGSSEFISKQFKITEFYNNCCAEYMSTKQNLYLTYSNTEHITCLKHPIHTLSLKIEILTFLNPHANCQILSQMRHHF